MKQFYKIKISREECNRCDSKKDQLFDNKESIKIVELLQGIRNLYIKLRR